MKKLLILVGAVVLVSLFASCGIKDERDAALRAADSLQQIVNDKDGEIDALFDVLNEIEDNLTMINAKYSNVQEMKRGNVESNYNTKKEIAAQISQLDSMLAANKSRIASLNAKINSLNRDNDQLKEFVAKLEERMASQEAQISRLQAEIESNRVVITNLNQNVADLTATVQEKEEVIAHQIAEANKAYFIVGTFKDLKNMGIVNKTGGFIGIGRTQNTVDDMITENFTLIDRTKVTTITINRKKAVVISKHPTNSYEMVMDETDNSVVAYLRILNPATFWSQTKYLVISTK
ncbi:MAG: hypothetical protein IJR26_09235 [Bacteroidales bacterium]|nr:hypothetical protein [Bacteroidales bacterium]MBQ9588026.1 hypothetical protein [Bacteroidales bacterium]